MSSRSASAVNGTDSPPYNIALNQLITWAGPYAGFRADNVSLDFKLLSVREIAPSSLPRTAARC